MKRLTDILNKVKLSSWEGPGDPRDKIPFASTQGRQGKESAFFAIKGTRTDGHKYIETVQFRRGQSQLFVKKCPGLHAWSHYVRVEDSALALGMAASIFLRSPISKADPCRHYRHQRENNHCHSPPQAFFRCRVWSRTDLHGQKSYWGRGA